MFGINSSKSKASKTSAKTSRVITDEKIIDEILSRSVADIYPEKQELKKVLMSGKKLRIYTGADATGPQLHLGHSVSFILLEKLRQLGHEVIVLFGDFTARIGDPTDKSAARVRLTDQQVASNIKNWKSQIQKIVNLKDRKNPARIVHNSKWLSKLSFEEIIELSSNFTVQQIIERDMFENRMKEGKPIYMHEFFYPLMQGYDSVVLDVDMEIGGTDQTFNMLAGRTLLSKLKNKNKFVVTINLLENPVTGKKLMSKSEGDYIAMDDDPVDMFGKVMALPDEVIVTILRSATLVDLEKVNEVESGLQSGTLNPRDVKVDLAYEIVKTYYSERIAQNAKDNFINTFSKKGGISDDAVEISANSGAALSDLLLEKAIVESKSQWRRLVGDGAVTDLDKDEKITDPAHLVTENINLKIGKKKFVKIVVSG